MEYDKLQLVENKANKLLSELNSDSENAYYTNALFLMIVIYLIALGYIYIKSGQHILLYLLASVCALLAYKLIVSKAAKQIDSSSSYKAIDPANKQDYVKGLLKHLSSLVNLKMHRVKALRILYMISFPFFLVMLKQIFFADDTTSKFISSIIVAILLGGIFWYLFFSNEIQEYEYERYEIDDMIKKL